MMRSMAQGLRRSSSLLTRKFCNESHEYCVLETMCAELPMSDQLKMNAVVRRHC
jgi:hypothetical protein